LVVTLRLPLYPDQNLGERIKKWRLKWGLFQVGLAKKVGVSEMTMVNWLGSEKASWGLHLVQRVVMRLLVAVPIIC